MIILMLTIACRSSDDKNELNDTGEPSPIVDSGLDAPQDTGNYDLGANQVIYSKEVAPGQTMDYYVQPTTREQRSMEGVTGTVNDIELVPLGPGDDRNAAQIIIEEYNPQEIKIPVLTLPINEPKAKGPFFLFGKKDGGKISRDGLVSITDIYGEY